MTFVLYQSEVVPKESVTISPFDTGVLIGDGVFTTLLIENGKPLFLEEHQKRLQKQASRMEMPFSALPIHLLYELINKNNAFSGYYRLKLALIAAGSGKREGILVGHLQPYLLKKEPLRLTIYPTPVEGPLAQIKSLSYFSRFLLMRWSQERGFDDCLVVDAKNHLLEASFSNFFWYEEGRFYYPDPILPLFFGITLETLQVALHKRGIAMRPIKKKFSKISTDSSLFLTNSLFGILPVASVNHFPYKRDKAIESKVKEVYEQAKNTSIIKLEER